MQKDQSCGLCAHASAPLMSPENNSGVAGGDAQSAAHCLVNCEQSLSHDALFESSLSSLVPSNGGHRGMDELIGRFATMPCYAAPKFAPFNGVQEFIDIAEKFSVFTGQVEQLQTPKSDGVLASQIPVSEKQNELSVLCPAQLGVNAMIEFSDNNKSGSSSSDESQKMSPHSIRMLETYTDTFARKNDDRTIRKKVSMIKRKETPLSSCDANLINHSKDENSDLKRCKVTQTTNGVEKYAEVKPMKEQNKDSGEKQIENITKPREPSKDYIHVRARRGQATDSHSLAERVRREKISERMKLLQNLVPGCEKLTGKAVMLDEIINYVQSLQRQVEFLSMKLATINSQLGLKVDNLLPLDIPQQCEQLPKIHSNSIDHQGSALQVIANTELLTQSSSKTRESSLQYIISMQLPSLDTFTDSTSQIGTIWEDDLQSVVQMAFHGN